MVNFEIRFPVNGWIISTHQQGKCIHFYLTHLKKMWNWPIKQLKLLSIPGPIRPWIKEVVS